MTDKPVPVTSADTALVGDLLVASHIVTGQAGKMPAGWTLVAIARRIHAPVASADAVYDWQRDPRWWNVLERPVNPWEWDAIEAAIRDTAALDVAYRKKRETSHSPRCAMVVVGAIPISSAPASPSPHPARRSREP
jgi:hypothetical protein